MTVRRVVPAAARRLRRLLSRLPARLLAFNLLLVLVPVGGLFSFGLHELLGRYERRLLDAQERSMAQQSRLLAAALADVDELRADEAERILVGLEQRLTARLRVYDADGEVLADSARLGPRLDQSGPLADTRADQPGESLLYRLGATPFRLWRRWTGDGAPADATETDAASEDASGPPAEIRAALDGRYGAEARPTLGDGTSLILHVAVPVRNGDRILGAAQASQSTYRVLEELRRVRLSFFEVFLASLVGAVLLSVIAAATIARPIRRLRTEAATLVDRRGRLRGTFSGSDSADEVGDLARTLEGLSRRIDQHVRFVESFAADVSHELRNPLASIRAATELLPDAEDPDERRHLLATVTAEVARMERLLAAVREIGLIDSRLDEEAVAPVDLGEILRSVTRAVLLRAPGGVELALDLPEAPVAVLGAPERIAQVVENLVDNAVGFSSIGSAVEIRLRAEPPGRDDAPALAVLTVADRGPGIPAEHMDRIFDRFFTYRPEQPERPYQPYQPRQEAPVQSGAAMEAESGAETGGTGKRPDGHTGLGLAIVQAIVEAYGGSVRARNRADGGAAFEVRLPAVPARPRANTRPGERATPAGG